MHRSTIRHAERPIHAGYAAVPALAPEPPGYRSMAYDDGTTAVIVHAPHHGEIVLQVVSGGQRDQPGGGARTEHRLALPPDAMLAAAVKAAKLATWQGAKLPGETEGDGR